MSGSGGVPNTKSTHPEPPAKHEGGRCALAGLLNSSGAGPQDHRCYVLVFTACHRYKHSYDIKYRKADLHCKADALSRLPLPVTRPEPRAADIFYFSQVDDAPVAAVQVRRATHNDPVLSVVMDIVMKGGSGSDNPSFQPYLSRRAELSVQSGYLLWGRRVVIPPSLRTLIL